MTSAAASSAWRVGTGDNPVEVTGPAAGLLGVVTGRGAGIGAPPLPAWL